MTIPAADVKQLWGRAASTCSMCRHKLEGVSLEGKAVVVGEAAHIVAGNKKGPRGCSILVDAERNSYFNLILLCPTCHTTIDKDPIGYPIERLYIVKAPPAKAGGLLFRLKPGRRPVGRLLLSP